MKGKWAADDREKALKYHKLMLRCRMSSSNSEIYTSLLAVQTDSSAPISQKQYEEYLLDKDEPEWMRKIAYPIRMDAALAVYWKGAREPDTKERLPRPIYKGAFGPKTLALFDVCLLVASMFSPIWWTRITLLVSPIINCAAIKYMCSSYAPNVAEEDEILLPHWPLKSMRAILREALAMENSPVAGKYKIDEYQPVSDESLTL